MIVVVIAAGVVVVALTVAGVVGGGVVVVAVAAGAGVGVAVALAVVGVVGCWLWLLLWLLSLLLLSLFVFVLVAVVRLIQLNLMIHRSAKWEPDQKSMLQSLCIIGWRFFMPNISLTFSLSTRFLMTYGLEFPLKLVVAMGHGHTITHGPQIIQTQTSWLSQITSKIYCSRYATCVCLPSWGGDMLKPLPILQLVPVLRPS